jgi:hypothetical protein
MTRKLLIIYMATAAALTLIGVFVLFKSFK